MATKQAKAAKASDSAAQAKDDTQDNTQEQAQEQAAQEQAPAPAPVRGKQANAEQMAFVSIGKDQHSNAQALEELLGLEPQFPFNVQIKNTIAMPLVLPLVPGFKLGHVAGDPAKSTKVIEIRSAAQLQQVSLDIHDILSLSGMPGAVLMRRTMQQADA